MFSAAESNFYSAITADEIPTEELVESLRSYFAMIGRMQALGERIWPARDEAAREIDRPAEQDREAGSAKARAKDQKNRRFLSRLTFEEFFLLATRIDTLCGGSPPRIGTDFALQDLQSLLL